MFFPISWTFFNFISRLLLFYPSFQLNFNQYLTFFSFYTWKHPARFGPIVYKKKNILHTLDRMFWNGTLFNLHYFSEQRLHVTSFKMKCLNLIYQHWHQICKTFFGLTKYLFGLENNWMCTFLLTHFNTWKTHQSHFSSTVMV